MIKTLTKIISVFLAAALLCDGAPLFSQVPAAECREGIGKLSPSSRFWRMPVISQDAKGEFIIEEDLSDEPLLNTGAENFRDDVVFLYMSRLIAQAMTEYRGAISAEGLVSLIEKHLSHLGPFNSSRFEWKDLYRDGNTFCLPYLKVTPTSRDVLLMRYYLPEDDQAGLFSSAFIPVGFGDVRVTCEWGEGITDSDALMVYLNIIKGMRPLSDLLYGPRRDPGNFFGFLFETFFVRLQHDFENTKEFIDTCRDIIEKEGIQELRNKIAGGDDSVKQAFLKIRRGRNTKQSSISTYGVLLFFITSTPGHIDAMQSTVEDLYVELVRRGFFPEDAGYRTKAEKGIYQRGEEIFEAQGRQFSLSDILEWKVPEDIYSEIILACPEIKEKAGPGELVFDMEEDALTVRGWKYPLSDLAAESAGRNAVIKLREKRDEIELILSDFRKTREETRARISWAMERLYEEFIPTRPAGELSFTRQGVSYHLAGHSVVHLYPKGLIYAGPDSVFMSSIMTNYGESIPADRTWTDNAGKIEKAIKVWESFDPASTSVRETFTKRASVVELDMDTRLLFSDPDKNVVRPLQMGRSRHVFYISKEYLDGLDSGNEEHMRELAFLLKLGESFLEKQETLLKSGTDLEGLQGAADDFNLHFLERSVLDPLIDIGEVRKRLSRGMKLDFIEKNTNSMEEILKDEEEAFRIQSRLDIAREDFSAVRSDIRKLFWLNYSLLSRYSGMGMSEMADKTYRKLKKATKDLQGHDRAGLMPYDFQVKLVFTALKFGYWDDFINEAETLLTGRNFPSGLLGEEKAFVRSLVSPVRAEGRRGLEDELMKALRAQIRVMSPGNAADIEKRIEGFIEESKKLEDDAVKDQKEKEDDFDRMVSSCPILDIEGTHTRDEVFEMVAREGALRTGMDKDELLDKFIKRESQGSTVVGPGLAIPHIALPKDKKYEIVIVRAKEGVIFPGGSDTVKAMFVLMGPRGEETLDAFHLKMMMAVAMIGRGRDFMNNWLNRADEEDLRLFLLNADRRRETRKEEDPAEKPRGETEHSSPEQGATMTEEKLDLAAEAAVARDLLDSLIARIGERRLFPDKNSGKIVVGIDMGLMPDSPEHLAALQGLINRINYISRIRGLGDVVVRRRKGGRELAKALRDVKRETGAENSNFVILGEARGLGESVFDEFREKDGSAGAFFAGVETPPEYSDDSYRRIVEMLTMALNAAFGVSLEQSRHPNVKFRKISERFYVFTPRAVKFDPKAYIIQKKEIDVRA